MSYGGDREGKVTKDLSTEQELELVDTQDIADAFQDRDSDVEETTTSCQSKEIRGKELKKRKVKQVEREDDGRRWTLLNIQPKKKMKVTTETPSHTSTREEAGSASGQQTTRSPGMPLLTALWTSQMEEEVETMEEVNEMFMVDMIEVIDSIINLMKKETEAGHGDRPLIQSLILSTSTYWSRCTNVKERGLIKV